MKDRIATSSRWNLLALASGRASLLSILWVLTCLRPACASAEPEVTLPTPRGDLVLRIGMGWSDVVPKLNSLPPKAVHVGSIFDGRAATLVANDPQKMVTVVTAARHGFSFYLLLFRSGHLKLISAAEPLYKMPSTVVDAAVAAAIRLRGIPTRIALVGDAAGGTTARPALLWWDGRYLTGVSFPLPVSGASGNALEYKISAFGNDTTAYSWQLLPIETSIFNRLSVAVRAYVHQVSGLSVSKVPIEWQARAPAPFEELKIVNYSSPTPYPDSSSMAVVSQILPGRGYKGPPISVVEHGFPLSTHLGLVDGSDHSRNLVTVTGIYSHVAWNQKQGWLAFCGPDIFLLDSRHGTSGRAVNSERVTRSSPCLSSDGRLLAMSGSHSPSDGAAADQEDVFVESLSSKADGDCNRGMMCLVSLPGPDRFPVFADADSVVVFCHHDPTVPDDNLATGWVLMGVPWMGWGKAAGKPYVICGLRGQPDRVTQFNEDKVLVSYPTGAVTVNHTTLTGLDADIVSLRTRQSSRVPRSQTVVSSELYNWVSSSGLTTDRTGKGLYFTGKCLRSGRSPREEVVEVPETSGNPMRVIGQFEMTLPAFESVDDKGSIHLAKIGNAFLKEAAPPSLPKTVAPIRILPKT